MASLILKPEYSVFTMRTEMMSTSPSGFGKAMLLVNRIAGAMLGSIGVMVLLANVLLGCMTLLLGTGFTIQLLAH